MIFPNDFVDRIIRPAERKKYTTLSDVHTRRLEEKDEHPRRFKVCPDSGPYGATGHMLSWLLVFNQWRAAGGPGSWKEWWAAHVAEQAKRVSTAVLAVLAVASVVAPFLANFLA